MVISKVRTVIAVTLNSLECKRYARFPGREGDTKDW
jgi:hypothetical protein